MAQRLRLRVVFVWDTPNQTSNTRVKAPRVWLGSKGASVVQQVHKTQQLLVDYSSLPSQTPLLTSYRHLVCHHLASCHHLGHMQMAC